MTTIDAVYSAPARHVATGSKPAPMAAAQVAPAQAAPAQVSAARASAAQASAADTAPAWWSEQTGSGEADPGGAEIGGTDDSLGFSDLLDVLNPLHHIPLVGTLYREISGDTISETARLTGGAVWGGPTGFVSALANTITERETGSDLGASALAFMQENTDITGDPATVVADAPVEVPAAAARDAADPQIAVMTTIPGAVPMPGQGFAGRSADALDAFIRKASAVRAPGSMPLSGPASAPQMSAPMVSASIPSGRAPASPVGAPIAIAAAPTATPTAARLADSGNTNSGADSRTASLGPGTPTPIKLAADGSTDVALWMSRALDRYEAMRKAEQS
jgi:hypothetical protein